MSAQTKDSSPLGNTVEHSDFPLRQHRREDLKPDTSARQNPSAQIRPSTERRTPPDRGIILLAAKDRIGPKIWALYGRVDRPIILKDDRFIAPELNDFYRDQQGRAFLLLPYAEETNPDRADIADAAYRRAVALGITERPEVFLTCLYHYQLPEYRCIAIHTDSKKDIIEEDKCLVILDYEKARLAEQLSDATIAIEPQKKIKPVTLVNVSEVSNNLLFALNTLYIHHGYNEALLNSSFKN